jgi:hypothetical protein
MCNGADCAPHQTSQFWERSSRFNGELRDREKVMRPLKTEDIPILKGMQIFHNYVRPHVALDGKTPSEVAGIKVEGENKWLTIIQNAKQNEKHDPSSQLSPLSEGIRDPSRPSDQSN